MRECSSEQTNIAEKPFDFAMDLVYFISEDCGNPAITVNVVQETTSTLTVNWSDSQAVTNRTFIILICYTVISALWVFSSLLVISSICGPVTRMVSTLCFWPWFLFVIAGSILDVVATGYHIHDIFHTTVR